MDKNLLIVKSNNLVEAFADMTQNECKMIAFLIAKIKPDDTKFLTQTITAKELNDLLGIEGTATNTYMKKCVHTLLSKKIYVKYTNGNRLGVNWFGSIEYIDNVSMLQICFNSQLKPFLLQLKNNYTKYMLMNICQLDSAYSIRVYELLKQYEKIGHRIISIYDLKSILGIKDKYQFYKDFKVRVILIAQRELHKTDINFTFEEIKAGRKVDALKFNIFKNGTHASQIEDSQIEDAASASPSPEVQNLKEEIERTVNGKIGAKGLKNLVDSVPLDTIKEYLTNWPKFTPGENPIGYFIKACIDRYTIPETINNKPIQATNYEQREYDDEFYDSLYLKFD